MGMSGSLQAVGYFNNHYMFSSPTSFIGADKFFCCGWEGQVVSLGSYPDKSGSSPGAATRFLIDGANGPRGQMRSAWGLANFAPKE